MMSRIRESLTSLRDWIKNNSGVISAVIIFILLLVIGVLLWLHFKADNSVVTMSQSQAETPTGVEIAADKAGITLSSDQSKQVASAIKYIREKDVKADYTVSTTGSAVKKDSEQAVKDNKADFAIVTDPNDPDKTVDLDKLDADTKVNLNQYNIHAYKKVIRQVNVGKNLNTGDNVVGFAISRKITDSGQYLGIGVDQEFGSNNNTIVKVIYSW